MNRAYQICTRCVMDTTDPDITFDKNGVCNHCHKYDEIVKLHVVKGQEGKKKLEQILKNIKEKGKGKPYDAILGISGGVDSTYVAWLAKQHGLRVLLTSLDNGYNPPETTQNVERIVKKLGFDFKPFILDFEEFRDLQLAFFRAGVINIEALTDHAIRAWLYRLANSMGIKHVLSGTNLVTEVTMPVAWGWDNNDVSNIVGIHKKFGTVPMKTFPLLGYGKLVWFQMVKGIQVVSPLNYVDYDKAEVKKLLGSEFGWEDYGAKHWESIFTRFYQAYILPTRFGIDKRRPHLSCLICDGQITRDEALAELSKPVYPAGMLERDKAFVLGKLRITDEEFRKLMSLPIHGHAEYGTDQKNDLITKAIFLAYGIKIKLKSLLPR